MKGLMQPHLSSEYFQQQIAKSDSALAWQYDRMLRFARVRLHHETCVLDVGCGAAPGLRYLRQRGVVAVGVDVSAAALAAARELAPDAALVRCDLERSLPFRDGQFDAALLSELVEHIAALPALLADLRRVLRPGGALVLTTPNLWDVRRLVGALGGPTWTGWRDPTHVNLQTPQTLRRHLERAGSQAVRVRAGWKPVTRVGGRRLPVRIAVPYPPLVGNGLLAGGRA
jgi:SAM-dependent methyltransferase